MKYSIEVYCDQRAASNGYLCEYLVAYGDTLEELLDSATVGQVTQNGNDKGYVLADEAWQKTLIYSKYLEIEASNQIKHQAIQSEIFFEDSLTVFLVGTIVVVLGTYGVLGLLFGSIK